MHGGSCCYRAESSVRGAGTLFWAVAGREQVRGRLQSLMCSGQHAVVRAGASRWKSCMWSSRDYSSIDTAATQWGCTLHPCWAMYRCRAALPYWTTGTGAGRIPQCMCVCITGSCCPVPTRTGRGRPAGATTASRQQGYVAGAMTRTVRQMSDAFVSFQAVRSPEMKRHVCQEEPSPPLAPSHPESGVADPRVQNQSRYSEIGAGPFLITQALKAY